MAVDRLPHGSRMRCEEKRRQVDSVAGERELGAHRGPVGQVGRSLDAFDLPQRHGAGGEARPRQQPAPRELRHVEAGSSSARQLCRAFGDRAAPAPPEDER